MTKHATTKTDYLPYASSMYGKWIIPTLTELVAQMKIAHERNIPFIAQSEDSGFSLCLETRREVLVFPYVQELQEEEE